MQEWIINVLNQFGYFGIAALIAIENIFPPIPSEVILTFSGFMTTYTQMNEWMVVLASTLGSLIGAILLYEVGSLVSQARLAKLLQIWNTILIWLGSFAGTSWRSVLEILDSYMLAILVIAAALGVVIGIFAYRRKRIQG